MTWHLASFGSTFHPIPFNPTELLSRVTFVYAFGVLGFFFVASPLRVRLWAPLCNCMSARSPKCATKTPPSPLFHLLYRWLPFWFPRALFFNSYRSPNLPDSFLCLCEHLGFILKLYCTELLLLLNYFYYYYYYYFNALY